MSIKKIIAYIIPVVCLFAILSFNGIFVMAANTINPPGGSTPLPGGTTPLPGGNTPTPGGNTPLPNGNTPKPNGQTESFNPFEKVGGQPISSLCQLVNLILRIILQVGGVVATLFIIWSGFLFVKAQGRPAEIEKAKWAFYTTIIGTAILLGATAISDLIFNTLHNVTGIGDKC